MTKKKKSLPVIPLPPIAAYLKAQKDATGMTYEMIAAKTGISDSTLSRWFNGHVADIKVTQLAKVAVAMEMSFWKLMARAQITDDTPVDPTAETQRIASIIADENDLQTLMRLMMSLGPRDRREVRRLAETLVRAGQDDLLATPEFQ